MIAIRHRTASGRLDSLWDFDPARGVVEVVLRLASARPVAFTIRVCSRDSPRLWCHPILRVDAESWRILPATWMAKQSTVDRHLPQLAPSSCAGRAAAPFPCDLHAVIGASEHVLLSNTPPNVDLEIAELGL